MNAIDIHAHAFPDNLAVRAIPALEAEAKWKAFLDGTIAGLLGSMDAAGVDASVVCTIATKPDQVEGIARWCESIRSERIVPFPSIHPDTPDPRGWMKRFADAGLRGIKLHPMYQNFAADDPRAMCICAAAAEFGLLVEVHCGRDVAFPPDDDRAAPQRIRRVLDATPGLKLVATHMGGWRMWDEVADCLLGADCWMETSFTFELPREKLAEMIAAHGADKILFGTDSPWADQAAEIARIRSLPLPSGDIEKVLHATAARLLAIEP